MAEAAVKLGCATDARRIAEAASGYEGAQLLLHLDDAVTARPGALFRELLDRRAAGEPLQYVVGHWGFRRLDLLVDRRVLIPRPETETVAGVAVDAAQAVAGHAPLVVELGTGSGAIAIAMADEVPTARVWATDTSADALAVARANLAGAGAKVGRRVRLVEGDWFAALPDELRGAVDVIVSNPPYVACGESLPEEVAKWEPATALYAGPRGTECIEVIVAGAREWLTPGGTLVVEIAPHQGDEAAGLARRAGCAHARLERDAAGKERVLVAGWR